MPISLNSFTQRLQAQDVNLDKKVFAREDEVKESSKFFFFRFSAKKTENDATVAKFIDSIRQDRALGQYANVAKQYLDEARAQGKPLTLRNVQGAMERVLNLSARDQSIVTNTGRLHTEGKTSFAFATELRRYCLEKQINIDFNDRDSVKSAICSYMSDETANKLKLCCELYDYPNFSDFIMKTVDFDTLFSNCFDANYGGEHYLTLENALENVITDAFDNFNDLVRHMPKGKLEEFKGLLGAKIVNEALSFTREALAQGKINNSEVFNFFNNIVMDNMATGAKVSTPDEKLKCMHSFTLANKTGEIAQNALREAGIPEFYAQALSLHPSFTNALSDKLSTLDFSGRFPTDTFMQLAKDLFEDFLEENKVAIAKYRVFAESDDFPKLLQEISPNKKAFSVEAKAPLFINAFISGEEYIATLISGDSIADPKAFATYLTSFTQSIFSVSTLVSEFGGDDALVVPMVAFSMHLLDKEFTPNANTLKTIKDELGGFCSELSSIESFIPKSFSREKKYEIELQASSLRSSILRMVNGFMAIAKDNGSIGDDGIVADGLNERAYLDSFFSPVDKTLPSQLLVETMTPFGLEFSQDATQAAVKASFLPTSTAGVRESMKPATKQLCEEVFSRLDLRNTIHPLTIDTANIRISAHSDDVIRDLKLLPETATSAEVEAAVKLILTSQMERVATTIQSIHQMEELSDADKQILVDIVLSAGVTHRPMIESFAANMVDIRTNVIDILAQEGPGTNERIQKAIASFSQIYTEIMQQHDTYLKSMLDSRRVIPAALNVVLNNTNASPAHKAALVTAMESPEMMTFGRTAFTIQDRVRGQKIDAEDRTLLDVDDVLLSIFTTSLQDFHSEANFYNGTSADDVELPPGLYSEEITDYKELTLSAYDIISPLLVTNSAGRIYSPITCALLNCNTKLSQNDAVYISGLFRKVCPHATPLDIQNTLAPLFVAKSADFLALRANGTTVSEADIYKILSGLSMPTALPPDDIARNIVTILESKFKAIQAHIIPEDSILHETPLLPLSMHITPELMVDFFLGNEISLQETNFNAQLPPIDANTAADGYGAFSNIDKMGTASSITLIDNNGNGGGVSPHPELAHLPLADKPHLQEIAKLATNITQNETQRSRVLQTLSDIPITTLDSLCVGLGGKSCINDNFDITATQQADDSVIVKIQSQEQNNPQMSLAYSIAVNGTVTCLNLDMQRIQR